MTTAERLIAQYESLIADIRKTAQEGLLPAPLMALAEQCEEHAAVLRAERVIDWEGAA